MNVKQLFLLAFELLIIFLRVLNSFLASTHYDLCSYKKPPRHFRSRDGSSNVSSSDKDKNIYNDAKCWCIQFSLYAPAFCAYIFSSLHAQYYVHLFLCTSSLQERSHLLEELREPYLRELQILQRHSQQAQRAYDDRFQPRQGLSPA